MEYVHQQKCMSCFNFHNCHLGIKVILIGQRISFCAVQVVQDRITLTSFMQPSKSVSMESTSAPLAIGCTSCARLILSAGRNTMDGMPACAQYADSAADVSPAHHR